MFQGWYDVYGTGYWREAYMDADGRFKHDIQVPCVGMVRTGGVTPAAASFGGPVPVGRSI